MKNLESKGRKRTALVVEDHEASMRYLQFLLKILGIEAITANTGEKALEIVQAESFGEEKSIDCMLLDIALGSGINGVTLMEELRKQEKFVRTPIIAVTASWSGELCKLIKRGFTDYIRKPYSMNQLEETLEKYLPK